MFLDDLRTRCGAEWPTIARAQAAAAEQTVRLRNLVQTAAAAEGAFDSEDLSIVVFGSLARGEWTSSSDLDWTLLIDGQTDQEHATTAPRVAQLFYEKGGFPKPGRTGLFGSMASSYNIIHQIGGQDDTNQNTTQRMLLLLESRAVHRSEAYTRVILGILRRYLKNDFRKLKPKVPRFLLNDLHRFWRTMCVDYANKVRERAGEGWALRNIKLRMSRKLIFAAGLLTCYSCAPSLLDETDPGLLSNPTVDGMVSHLRRYVERTPLEIVSEGLLRYSRAETARPLLDAYDAFLGELDKKDVRDRLSNLPADGAEDDDLFKAIQQHCRSFQDALVRLFFEDNHRLAALTREYGVF